MDELNNILVIHLTDLHFGASLSKSLSYQNFSHKDTAMLIAETIKEVFSEKKIILVLGGDLTNKGEPKKYQYVYEFLNVFQDELSGYEIDHIFCPGNHDIEIGKDDCFGAFNIFTTEVTRSEDFIYTDSKTSVVFEKHNLSFVTTNSLFHKDHTFGLIQIDNLEHQFLKSNKSIILITHHHLIPMYKEDVSVTRNSYDVIRLCQKYNVKLILHGHIHSSFKLRLSEDLLIIGCGAALPELSANYNNQFNVINISENGIKEIVNFRIIYDSVNSYKPQVLKTNL